jgi:hypothetical protein
MTARRSGCGRERRAKPASGDPGGVSATAPNNAARFASSNAGSWVLPSVGGCRRVGVESVARWATGRGAIVQLLTLRAMASVTVST